MKEAFLLLKRRREKAYKRIFHGNYHSLFVFILFGVLECMFHHTHGEWAEGWWNVNKWRDYICRMNSWKGEKKRKKAKKGKTSSRTLPTSINVECVFCVWFRCVEEARGRQKIEWKKCLLILGKSFYCSNCWNPIDTIEKSTRGEENKRVEIHAWKL